MHTSNLSESIPETLVVSIQDISSQVSLKFLKPFGLLTKLGFRSVLTPVEQPRGEAERSEEEECDTITRVSLGFL